MPQYWTEPFDPRKHTDHMDGSAQSCGDSVAHAHLLVVTVYFVRVCSFTFEFHNIAQIQAAIGYYDRKVHQTSRLAVGAADHWECERWFERLPQYLLEEPKRERVVKSLRRALIKFGNGR